MSQPSLSGLSNEVLLQIFSHFCLHCQDRYNQSWDARPLRARPFTENQEPNTKSWYSLNRHALFSMSLTSKRLRDISQQVLYHEFVLGYGDSWASDLYSWKGRLMSFMRTLTKRPDLAKLVKVVYVHTYLLDDTPEEKRAALMEAAHGLGIDLPNAWRQRISDEPNGESSDWLHCFNAFLFSFLDGKEYPNPKANKWLKKAFPDTADRWLNAEVVAMLVAQLPSLDYLSVQGDFHWPAFGFSEGALSALNVSRLPLKTLDLGVDGDAIIALAARLETLNLHQTYVKSPVPPMPNLKKLRITKVQMTHRKLQDILTACTRGLEAFEYEADSPDTSHHCHGPTPPFDPERYPFHPPQAIQCLKTHTRTLELLHLDLSLRNNRMTVFSPGANLKDLTGLKHLFLSSNTIFDIISREADDLPDSEALVRILPVSIVSLSIIGGDKRVKKGLLGLADLKNCQPNEFPKLKYVSYFAKGTTKSTLSSMFSAIGVEYDHKVPRLSRVKPYLNGPNDTNFFPLPIYYSDEDL
ncbi:hypothetical protein B0T10DRAFT_497717 [Thelonectria olida]|uniref:Uncharacterized protein n=1 Tax=Thelonectria olida TaxID=1576542 RepID=A0A9P8VTN4_9HYPO|nr:hypothetical protein B0T10DRAFT_497717 [Thelonectria olida]